MSDAPTSVAQKTDEQIIAESPFAKPIHITRNGTTGTLQVFVGKRNEWKDRAYPAFQIESENFKAGTSEHDAIVHDKTFINGLVFIGKENIKKFVNVILRRNGQDMVEDAIPEKGDNAGILQMDVLIKSWETLQAAQLKLSELVELYNEAVVKFQHATPNFVAEMTAAGGDPEKMAAATAKFQTYSDAVNLLKNEYEIRKAKRSKEAQAETVTPT